MSSTTDTNLTRRVAEAMGVRDGAAVASFLMPLYFICTLLPISLTIAGQSLSPLRVLLLVLFIPFAARILQGKVGRVTPVDLLMAAHAAWIFLALIVVHGTARIPYAGITVVELVGGYLLGRVLVRGVDDYRRMIRFLLNSLIFLLPFALIELITGTIVIAEIVGNVFETISRGRSAYGRMGLERVYAVFAHPILYGLFCSLAIANLYYMARGKGFLRFTGMLFATFMTFMSLSSAPLLACMLQFMLIAWDKITKGKWKLLIILSITFYVVIDSLSNRTPVTILIETLTFNASTGWTRIAIFEYGMRNAMANPLFGIGFNDWVRPFWLTSSVDNFWLFTAMSYGFPAVIFLIIAMLIHFAASMRAQLKGDDRLRIRTGHLITLAAICFTLATVHMWGAAAVFVMFYIGSGAWIYTSEGALRDADDEPIEEDSGSSTYARGQAEPRYTRFAPSNKRQDRRERR